jgi:hypothetical protein
MSSHSFEVARFSAMQVVTELEISHRMEKSLLSQRELISWGAIPGLPKVCICFDGNVKNQGKESPFYL